MTTLHTAHRTPITSRWSLLRRDARTPLRSDARRVALRQFVDRVRSSPPCVALAFPLFIAFAALLLLIPTTLLSRDLRSEVEGESLTLARRLASLSASPPLVSPEAQQEYLQSCRGDIEQIEQRMRQTTQRELLDYRLFPTPSSSSVLLFEEFGQRYCSCIEAMLDRADAGHAPSMAEIDSALAQIPGLPRSSAGPRAAYSRMEEAALDAVCLHRARSLKFYADRSSLPGYAFWQDYTYAGRRQGIRDCWYWQLGYWIVEDVIETIRRMNHDADSVLTAPVKRLTRIGFDHQRYRTRKDDEEPCPRYVTSASEGLTRSLTGRLCDEWIDVVHFDLEVVLRSNAVASFMNQLCTAKEHRFRGFDGTEPERTFQHNQITILETAIEPVSRHARQHRRYRYGDDTVVQLRLVCEYLFEKAGYASIQPECVKEDLTEALACALSDSSTAPYASFATG
jgi:hypothetical protein